MPIRPVGTIENVRQNAAFRRPYGTQNALGTYFPSSKLLGYYCASLRDEMWVTTKGVAAWAREKPGTH